VTRRPGPAGALALAALALAGCGSGSDAANIASTPPSVFVDAVRDLVRPAGRMGVIATAALGTSGVRASGAEMDALVDDAARELREFRALRPGDQALVAEQSRLVAAMGPVVARMRRIRSILRTDDHSGLADSTTRLLDSLEAMPSAARS
jgi:hypothetical protein